MKQIFMFFLSVALVVALMLLVACAPEASTPCIEHTDTDGNLVCDTCGSEIEPTCTSHRDENADKLCDICSTEFFPRCSTHTDANKNALCDICGANVSVKVSIILKDQEGACISGVTVVFTDEELNEYSVITDENGEGELELYCITYRVSYDTTSDGTYFPEGYLPIGSTVTVSSSNPEIALEILKTEPNGEASRPFPLSDRTTLIDIPESTLYHYIIYHSQGRNVSFEGSNFKVVYGGKEYTPNESGKIDFTLSEMGADENSFFTVENLSDSPITVSFLVYADPGTYGNPYIIDSNNISYDVEIVSGGVYFNYTATANGTLTVNTKQPLMFKSELMSDAMPLIKISGEDGALDGVYTVVAENITYTFTFNEGTVTIADDVDGVGTLNGVYSYEISDDGVFVLEQDGAVANVTLFKGGNTVVVTCSSNSKQFVISGHSETISAYVKEGEVVRILVNSEYVESVSFGIEFNAEVTQD